MKKTALIVTSAFFLLASAPSAFGQEKKAARSAKKTTKSSASKGKAAPKKVNVEGLEKRYWAPKDKKFSVVQNRTYTKTKKLALTFMPGLMLNEEFSEGFSLDFGVGYMFNDRWGLEFNYQHVLLDDNDAQEQINNIGGFANHGKITDYIGVTGKWMPFYAKMSFLSKRIIYFDMTLGVTAGMTIYEQQLSEGPTVAALGLDEDSESAFTFGFEVSQSFYLSKRLTLRVDYKHRWHNQEIIDGSTLSNIKGKVEDRLEDNLSLNVGVTYLLF